jgi:hypothetical protein
MAADRIQQHPRALFLCELTLYAARCKGKVAFWSETVDAGKQRGQP